MKIFYQGCFLLVVSITSFSACQKFDVINTNPNSPSSTTSDLLATNLILNITKSAANKSFLFPVMRNKQVSWAETVQGEQYNSFGEASFDGMQVLTNVQHMIELAPAADKNAYTGLGMFIKAYKLYYLSLNVGDIPYSEALLAEKGIVKPKYDTQKKVMIQVLEDLETAAGYFAAGKSFGGDPIFSGNVDNWRRVVNSFRLKVLLSLSKKEGDVDLKIKERFAKILANEPLLRDNADNLQLVYSDRAGQIYPFNNTINRYTSYAMISSVLMDSLKKYNDYRLFYYAAPSRFKLESELKTADDWDAYQGTNPAVDFSEVVNAFNANKYSSLNLRYTSYAAGEPNIRIGFSEQSFIIAEAIIKGWTPGNAKAYYEDGIAKSMSFIVKVTPDEAKYHSGRKMTSAYIEDYLNGSYVAFASLPALQIKQIWMQKYLMYFMQYSDDAYYDYRRTGYPNLPINPATSTNPFDKTEIPVRYTYPSEEYNYNLENLKVALDRQYNGNDRSDGVMWILQ